jgi:hypothetical protein
MVGWNGPTPFDGDTSSLTQGLTEVDEALEKISRYLGDLWDKKVPDGIESLLKYEGNDHGDARDTRWKIRKHLLGAIETIVAGAGDFGIARHEVNDALAHVEELQSARPRGLPVE